MCGLAISWSRATTCTDVPVCTVALEFTVGAITDTVLNAHLAFMFCACSKLDFRVGAVSCNAKSLLVFQAGKCEHIQFGVVWYGSGERS